MAFLAPLASADAAERCDANPVPGLLITRTESTLTRKRSRLRCVPGPCLESRFSRCLSVG